MSNLKNSTKIINPLPQPLDDTPCNPYIKNDKVDGISYPEEGETFNSKI